MALISPSEKDFITKGIEADIRNDGRTRIAYRDFTIETGIVSQASGSCRLRLSKTDVLIGVKVEIGDIISNTTSDNNNEQEQDIVNSQNESDKGRIVCSVECSPSASRDFEGKGANDINNELSQIMNRVLNGPQGGIDLKSLCIIPGAQCWIIYVDVLVLDYDGNLLDTIFLATRAALQNTRIPKTEIQDIGNGQLEFEISDDIEDAEKIKGWEDVPITVSLNKIGQKYIVDATAMEELCTDTKIIIAVNKKGEICAMQKSLCGSLNPSLLTEMIRTAKDIGKILIINLDTTLEHEQVMAARANNKKFGFFI